MSHSTTAPTSSSTKKATKAVVATALGVALLAAGGGTFANWSHNMTYDSADIESGHLELTTAGGTWTNALGTPIDLDSYVVVPGEVLTFTDTIGVLADGDVLAATLSTNLSTITTPAAGASAADAAFAAALQASHVLEVDGTVVDEEHPFAVTEENDGDELDVQLQVAFPASVTGVGAQQATANLTGLQVAVTQNAVAAG